MSFIIKKKRYRFLVKIVLDQISSVTYMKAVIFAKLRQIDGGSYSVQSHRVDVHNNMVNFNLLWYFPCKMYASASTGILETCKCRISIRKEEKGGRQFRKIGFVDINLAEYAAAGPSVQRYILQPYKLHNRLDNSLLQVSLNVILKEGDTIFRRPFSRDQPILLPGEDRLNNLGSFTVNSTSIASSSSSESSKYNSSLVPNVTSICDTSAVAKTSLAPLSDHTRNSSMTSQLSQASAGYNSLSQGSQPGQQSIKDDEIGIHIRNISYESSDGGFFGSMDKEKRRRKLGEGRVDPHIIINEILEGVGFDKVDEEGNNNADSAAMGLQLFVGKDGTVTFK